MLAMVLNHPGDEDAFDLEERPIPQAKTGWSVIKIKAFGLNHAELITRAGGSPSVKLPRVIGIEAVGEIYDSGDKTHLPFGQKVITLMGGLGRKFDGSYEEYVLVPDTQIYPVETDLSWEELATIPESFWTAYGSLLKMGDLNGQSLLIRGGTSSVGVAALLLAKSLGAVVTSTTRQPQKAKTLKQLGADKIAIEKDGTLTTSDKFDGILELDGPKTLLDSFTYADEHTVTVVTGSLAGDYTLDAFSPFGIPGYLAGFESTHVDRQKLNQMFGLINQNHLSLPIIQKFSLQQIPAAHKLMAKNSSLGKIIVVNNADDTEDIESQSV